MNDAEIIAEEMRVRVTDGDTVLEIAVVDWPNVHTPRVCWQKFRSWSISPPPEEIATALAAALVDPKFFLRCDHCGELCNKGYMHDGHVCMGCAEAHLGVVH